LTVGAFALDVVVVDVVMSFRAPVSVAHATIKQDVGVAAVSARRLLIGV
jgi:hypothetical protein